MFVGSPGRESSGLHNEVLVSEEGVAARLPNTQFRVNGSVDKLEITTANSSVTGVLGTNPNIRTLVVAAPGVQIEGVEIGNLTFTAGVDFGAIRLTGVILESSTHIGPSAAQHTIDVGGTVIDNIEGGSVAFLRPKGNITCRGKFTRCFLLQHSEGGSVPSIIFSQQGAQVVNVSAITSTFSENYLIDFFAFDKASQAKAAQELATALIWPTIAVLLSVLLAHGKPKKLDKIDKVDTTKEKAPGTRQKTA